MKSFLFLLCAVGALVVASPALADHCDGDVAAVDSAAATTTVGSNIIVAAAGLVEHAMDACAREQADIATAPLDSPLLDPLYVSIGRAMLINAAELLRGE